MNPKMKILAILFILLPIPSISGNVTPTPVKMPSLNVDMVIILHNGAQYWKAIMDGDCDECGVKKLGRNLHDTFGFGRRQSGLIRPNNRTQKNTKTHVALVANQYPEPRWHVYMKLTNNWTEFDEAMQTVTPYETPSANGQAPGREKLNNDLGEALTLARGQFDGNEAERPRVVFIITQSAKWDKGPAIPITDKIQQEGRMLREMGVIIYVLTGHLNDQNNNVTDMFRKLVGNYSAENLHEVVTSIDRNLNPTLLETIKTNLTRQFCEYETCVYADQSRKNCTGATITPKMPDVFRANCTAMGYPPPVNNESCDVTKCNDVCNKHPNAEFCRTTASPPRTVQSSAIPPVTNPGEPGKGPRSEENANGSSSLTLILSITIPIVVVSIIGVVIIIGVIVRRKRKEAGQKRSAMMKGFGKTKEKKTAKKSTLKKKSGGKKKGFKSAALKKKKTADDETKDEEKDEEESDKEIKSITAAPKGISESSGVVADLPSKLKSKSKGKACPVKKKVVSKKVCAIKKGKKAASKKK